MAPELRTWHWGIFLIYCVGSFFAAMALGCMGIPGIIVVAVGVVFGVWAALRGWFEVPAVAPNAFADRNAE